MYAFRAPGDQSMIIAYFNNEVFLVSCNRCRTTEGRPVAATQNFMQQYTYD